MKKGIVCLLCALMAASLTACKGQPEQEISSTASGTVTAGVSSDSPAEESSAVSERSDAVSSKKAEVSSKAVSSKKAPVSSRQSEKKTSSKAPAKVSSEKTQETSSIPRKNVEGTPEWVLLRALDALKSGDSEAFYKYVDRSSAETPPEDAVNLSELFPEKSKQINSLCFDKLNYYVVHDGTISSDRPAVTVTINNAAVSGRVSFIETNLRFLRLEELAKPEDQRMSDLEYAEAVMDMIIKAYQSVQKVMIMENYGVDLIKKDGKWMVEDEVQLFSLIFGQGYNDIFSYTV